MAEELDLRTATAASFEPHVGTAFVIVAGEERRELCLERVEEKPRLMKEAVNPDGSPFYERAPFALVFTGPREELFGQATFEIHHAALGKLVLFVKPYAEQGEVAYYEALIS